MNATVRPTVDAGTVKAGAEATVAVVKGLLAVGLGIAVLWTVSSLTGFGPARGLSDAVSTAVKLPIALTRQFIDTSIGLLDAMFRQLKAVEAQLKNVINDYGYTSKRGLFAAFSTDTGYVPGRTAHNDHSGVPPVFRAQGRYDASKGRVFVDGLYLLSRNTLKIVHPWTSDPNNGTGFFPPGYRQPWFPDEGGNSNGVIAALQSYLSGLREVGDENLAYILGRELAKSSKFSAQVRENISAGRTKASMPRFLHPHEAAFQRGFREAGNSLLLEY